MNDSRANSSGGAEPPGGLETLDRSVLQQFIDLEGLSPGLVARLTQLYLAGSPPLISAIAAALEAGDAVAASEQAHALKGSSLNVGAKRLAHFCGRLEAQARLGDLQGAEESVPLLADEFGRVRELLERDTR